MTQAKKAKKQVSGKDVAFNIFLYALCILILIIIAYPLYFIIIASFSNPSEVANGNVWFWPSQFTLDGYKELFRHGEIWMGYWNTILYTVIGTLIGLVVNISAAYSLSRKDLVGRKLITFFFIFTMFFNGGMVPLYMLVQQLGLLNNMWGLILPTTLSVYNMTIARAFFQSSIPDGIIEAAQIDGCSNIGTFFRIVLPVSPAIISVMCLFHVVFRWNEYFNAMMFFTKPDLYPLQLVLRDILINNTMTQVNSSGADAMAMEEMRKQAQLIKYSSIVVSTVPMLILYPFLQKYFVKGIMVGSLKG